MEHMDLDQPTIRNEEQKKSKLHARDGEDDTSYPSEKCGKHDLGLPEEKPAVEDYQFDKLFNFEIYISHPAQVYEDLVIQCKKEIEDCERALDEASTIFKINFEEDLEQKQPSRDSTYVIETIRSGQQKAKRDLDLAMKHLPFFMKEVKNYVKFRDGPLLAVKVAENQYVKKINELVEIPNVEKLIKGLLYNVKDDKEIERRSGLTPRDMAFIIFSLEVKNHIIIPYEKENTMEEEQYGGSEMEDLLIEHKDNIKELSSLRYNIQTAKNDVNEYVGKSEDDRYHCLVSMKNYLGSVDFRVRIMCQQLEMLRQKDVIVNGYEANFDNDWIEACQPKIGPQQVNWTSTS